MICIRMIAIGEVRRALRRASADNVDALAHNCRRRFAMRSRRRRQRPPRGRRFIQHQRLPLHDPVHRPRIRCEPAQQVEPAASAHRLRMMPRRGQGGHHRGLPRRRIIHDMPVRHANHAPAFTQQPAHDMDASAMQRRVDFLHRKRQRWFRAPLPPGLRLRVARLVGACRGEPGSGRQNRRSTRQQHRD